MFARVLYSWAFSFGSTAANKFQSDQKVACVRVATDVAGGIVWASAMTGKIVLQASQGLMTGNGIASARSGYLLVDVIATTGHLEEVRSSDGTVIDRWDEADGRNSCNPKQSVSKDLGEQTAEDAVFDSDAVSRIDTNPK